MILNIDTLELREDALTTLSLEYIEDGDIVKSPISLTVIKYFALIEALKTSPMPKLDTELIRMIMLLQLAKRGTHVSNDVFNAVCKVKDVSLTTLYGRGYAVKLLLGVKTRQIKLRNVTIDHCVEAYNIVIHIVKRTLDHLETLEQDLITVNEDISKTILLYENNNKALARKTADLAS